MPWIPPLLPSGQTGGVGVGCYFTSLAFMGVGLSSYRNSCQAPSWRQQWFIPDLSRAFSLILSLLHYIICCLAPSCPFFLISLQLGTLSPSCTTPPPRTQTSRISPLQGGGVWGWRGLGWRSASLSILSGLFPCSHPITRLVIAGVMAPRSIQSHQRGPCLISWQLGSCAVSSDLQEAGLETSHRAEPLLTSSYL